MYQDHTRYLSTPSRSVSPRATAALPLVTHAYPRLARSKYLGNNDEVEVTLAPKVPINRVGAPQLSRWALIAFVCSEVGHCRDGGKSSV